MPIRHKAQFPVPGCIVEVLQGNSPTIAYVLEAQNDKVRLYTQTKKEMKLPPSRLLPWFGPTASPSLSRAEIDALLAEHQQKRHTLKQSLAMEELWQLAEGEIQRASAGWFASLVFDDPDIDCEAAMGHALLDYKTHFKFFPPEFEIYPQELMEKRVEEAQAAQLRETLALHGNKFFHKLWEVHFGKETLHGNDIPEPEVAQKLEGILHAAMGTTDSATDSSDALWKLLSRGLPNDPHLPLHLAVTWGIVPDHYNFLLNRAGYDATDAWTEPHAEALQSIRTNLTASLGGYGEALDTPFITVDPDSTIDRDDAFFVERDAHGHFLLHVAIACPSLVWPFGTPFDKDVLRRATSLYLPEGDLHMLPASIGCSLFSLNAAHTTLALVTTLSIDENGVVLDTALAIQPIRAACNMTLCQAETLIDGADRISGTHNATTESDGSKAENWNAPPTLLTEEEENRATGDTTTEDLGSFEQLLEQSEALATLPSTRCPADVPNACHEYAPMLATAHALAMALRSKRLENGAVILERPDCDISLTPLASPDGEHPLPTHSLATDSVSHDPATMQKNITPAGILPADTTFSSSDSPHEILPQGLTRQDTCLVHIEQAPSTPKAHLVIGELMIAANAAMGRWATEQGVPLLYRNQDIALPPEYAAVWSQPQDIAKIARSLPAASLEVQPRKHAGLGISAYATCTSPIRRYVDLLNQGQIIAHLCQKPLPHSVESLNTLLPLLQARLDSVGHIQRTRPRYWKLLFFRQQGDKKWWPGVLTEENNAFATVALPWAQMMVRGRRKLFDEKIIPGAHVMIRVGKVHPLQNEIALMEVLEQ